MKDLGLILLERSNSLARKSLDNLTDHCISIFDNSFCDLTNNERNKRIMRDISGCVATLNKNHFLKKFNNLNFEYQDSLEQSNSYVSE